MKFTFLLTATALTLSTSVQAQMLENSDVDIIAATTAIGQLNAIDAGLRIHLPDGWYTYWRMPGDAGLAPVFTWSDQENIKEIDIQYPKPKRFETAGMHSFGYGYGGDVILPITITPEIKGEAIKADLKLDMMICKEICIPETHELSLRIHAGEPYPAEHAVDLANAKIDVPHVGDLPRLKINAAVLGKEGVVVSAESQDGFDDNADVILEVKNNIMNAPAQMIQGADKTRAIFKIPAPDYIEDLPNELFGESVTITFINGDDAIEKDFQF